MFVPTEDQASRMVAIHQAHAADLRRFLLGLTRGDRTATDDLLQEAMLRTWRHIDNVPEDEEGRRKWLFTVARRLFIDAARMRNNRPVEVHALDLAWMPGQEDTPDLAMAGDAVRHAFDNLSPAHRDVLSEIYFRGHTAEETAGLLGIPVGTVRSRAHYALRALKGGLAAA